MIENKYKRLRNASLILAQKYLLSSFILRARFFKTYFAISKAKNHQ